MSILDATAAVVASGLAEDEFLSSAWTILVDARTEIALFAVAMVAYFLLFMQRNPKPSRSQVQKCKAVEEDCREGDCPRDAFMQSGASTLQECAQIEKALHDAFDGGDYRSVMRCWNTMKKFDKMPFVSLPHVVEAMQRLKKDTPFILNELRGFMSKFRSECDIDVINDLIESLAKRLDSDLIEKIIEMLPLVGHALNPRSYELLLNMYFTSRNFQDVKALVSQMRAKRIPFTSRAALVVIKTALKVNDFDEALQYFRALKSDLSTQSSSTISVAPAHVVSALVEMACKEHKLHEFLPELHGTSICDEVLNNILVECVRKRDLLMTCSVEKLARDQGIHLTTMTYGLLIRGVSADPIKVQSLFTEMVEKDVEMTSDLASAILAVCGQTHDIDLAEKLYAHMKPSELVTISAFIRFFADNELNAKACDIYEQDLLPLSASQSQRSLPVDARMERTLMNSALKCGRQDIAKTLLSSSPSDIAKHITMIRNCAAERNLEGAMSVFDSLENSGVDLNSIIYNTVLDACVECRNMQAAETWMARTKSAGMADVVSFNTLVKAHLQNGHFEKARALVQEIRNEGLEPNRVTFNELINALGSKGGAARRKQMWDIVEEMNMTGVKPNQVTISILLKSLQSDSSEADILKTMDLINTMDEPMDEVLLSSVVEACVRIGKPDLLASKLEEFQGNTGIVNGSHTFGSLIKAYGHAKDIAGVWRCWKQMRSRHIKPTSVTLGCMIEAIVANGDTEGAFDLLHQIQDDEHCQGVLNSVIYCSLLKGFAREKKMDRVWAVYNDMKKHGVEVSIVAYNTLIDGCARSQRMDQLENILEDMMSQRVKPTVITYGTMVKGHCQSGCMQKAFSILEDMKKSTQLKPDEIMYNSLLDGCAQNNLTDDGLRLLEEMQREGVRPSNFTLSILVKLMNRARRLDQAFSLVEDISREYKFKPNVHVLTNLVQACVSNHRYDRGMSVLEEMIKDNIAPENRTYAILIRASISKGLFGQAVNLLRGALGLPGALTFLRQPLAVCLKLDHALVNETLSSLAERGHSQSWAVPLLSDIRQYTSRVHIDPSTQRKVMSPCMTITSSVTGRQGKGKGKGRGGWN